MLVKDVFVEIWGDGAPVVLVWRAHDAGSGRTYGEEQIGEEDQAEVEPVHQANEEGASEAAQGRRPARRSQGQARQPLRRERTGAELCSESMAHRSRDRGH